MKWIKTGIKALDFPIKEDTNDLAVLSDERIGKLLKSYTKLHSTPPLHKLKK